MVSFTRTMAQSLASRGIRVNAAAPGPGWTPLIRASFPADTVSSFDGGTMVGRPAEPDEMAPSHVFLASDDAALMTPRVLHPNGGQPVGS